MGWQSDFPLAEFIRSCLQQENLYEQTDVALKMIILVGKKAGDFVKHMPL